MSDLNIGKVIIDQTKTSQVTVNYADTSKPDTSTITSNRTQMTATVDSISTAFEVSKTYYFDADGGLVTTNQGYGTLGTTDSYGVLTVEIKQVTLQDFRIEESEAEYRVAEDIHFTAYVNYGNLPSIWTVYAQYSSDGIIYEDIQSATVGGSGLANITGCLIPAGASGTIYLRARVGDVYSDPIEATVVTPEIVISAVDVTVDVPFTISGTCNLAKNLRISYAKDPYSSWTVVDNSVTVQPNGTWSVSGVVISETGNFRLKAEYIQDTVAMFDDTEDVEVASAYVEGKVILVANEENTYIAQLSVDSGANFSDIGGAIEDNTRCSALSADGKYGLLGGVGGYLIKIVDGIATTAVNVSATWVDCSISDSGQYQIAISSSGYYFSDDYGITWSAFQTAKGFSRCAINPTGQYISVFQSNGKAYFSNDYGANWNEVPTGYCDSICMSPDGAVVYVGNNSSTGQIKRYTSNGNSTSIINTPYGSSPGAKNIVCHNDGFFLLQTYGNDTLVSTDYGVSFTAISVKPGAIYPGSGKLSPDGSIFYCNANNGYIYSLSSPWTEFIQKASGCYFWQIDCSYDGKYIVASRNRNGAGGIGYSDDYGVNFTTKLSTARTWSKIAISTKKLPS